MDRDRLREAITRAEGTGPIKRGRFMPYWDCCGRELRASCPKSGKAYHPGKLTIGHGHNIEDNGLTLVIDSAWTEEDINGAIKDLHGRYGVWFDDLDPPRQAVLVELCFMLGLDGFSEFRKMIAAVARDDYESAAAELLDSELFEQVGSRALRMAEQLRTGKWA